MNRKISTALKVLSLGSAIACTLAAPSYAASSQSTPVAFQGASNGCTDLWTWGGVAGHTSSVAGRIGSPTNISGCTGMADGTSPSEVALANGDVAAAFSETDGGVTVVEGQPGAINGERAFSVILGTNTETNLVSADSSPSLAIGPSDSFEVAFSFPTTSTCSSLWTGLAGAGQPALAIPGTCATGGAGTLAPGTSPSAAALANGNMAVAWQGTDGRLWTWQGPVGGTGTYNTTGLGMAPGTSPSITTLGGGDVSAVAFQANTGFLWTWEGTAGTLGVGASTGLGMAGGTSPSITTGVNGGNAAVAFEANTGYLWTWVGDAGSNNIAELSTQLGMINDSSPSITALANGQAAVAFQANTGVLWTWTGNAGTAGVAAGPSGCAATCPNGGLVMEPDTSPSIVAAIPSPHGLSLTADGNLLVALRKPRTLVLVVYSTPKRSARRKLLGQVALGEHPAGLSRVSWGLRVDGHHLGPGRYLVELEARIDGLLTVGGPTVNFYVGQNGKPTILNQSCSARAGATGC